MGFLGSVGHFSLVILHCGQNPTSCLFFRITLRISESTKWHFFFYIKNLLHVKHLVFYQRKDREISSPGANLLCLVCTEFLNLIFSNQSYKKKNPTLESNILPQGRMYRLLNQCQMVSLKNIHTSNRLSRVCV